LDSVESRLDSVEWRLDSVESRLDRMERKQDRAIYEAQFEQLDLRVTKLERKIR